MELCAIIIKALVWLSVFCVLGVLVLWAFTAALIQLFFKLITPKYKSPNIDWRSLSTPLFIPQAPSSPEARLSPDIHITEDEISSGYGGDNCDELNDLPAEEDNGEEDYDETLLLGWVYGYHEGMDQTESENEEGAERMF